MWIVVYFNADMSVECVPNMWYNKGSCAWPKKRANISSFIDKCIDPDERSDEFRYYDARILSKNPFDDINIARKKAKKAQQTSDLSSTENESYKENPKFKTSLFPPNRSEKSSSVCVITEENNGLTFPDFGSLFNDLDGELELNDNGINHTPENWLNTPASNKDINLNEFDENQVSLHDNNPSSTKKIKLTSDVHQYTTTTSTPIMKPVAVHSESDKKAYSYKIVNRNIITLKHEVKNMQDRLDIVINMQEKMYEHLCNSQVKNNASLDEFNDFDIMCIDNEADLNIMEQKLTEDELFKKSMIKQLSRLMGQTIPETVRKVMKTLFTDSFISEFSYIGFKGKNNFSTLKTCKVIFVNPKNEKIFQFH